MIDTHAHIYLKEFRDDLDRIIDSCKNLGIKKIYMPNIDSSSIDDMLEVESRYKGYCVPMMGLHPGSVDGNFQKELYIVEEWLGKRPFAAVGEIGMDLYWDKTYEQEQKEVFQHQIELAKNFGLPIVIHNRDAFAETYGMVHKLYDDRLKGIFHCFTGSMGDAEKITAMGFYLGIGGVVTYKKGGLDKVIPDVGLEHLVLETDSPYLAPVPFRGKRNNPGNLIHIVERVAGLKNTTHDEVLKVTSVSAEAVFAL
jgi:TatD DNase family protein